MTLFVAGIDVETLAVVKIFPDLSLLIKDEEELIGRGIGFAQFKKRGANQVLIGLDAGKVCAFQNRNRDCLKELVRRQMEKDSFDTEEPPTAEVGSGPDFVRWAERELKRSERYPSFVSLVTFEVVPVGYEWDEGLKRRVAEVAERSVRETDLVGISDAFRVAVLLVETPRRGALKASERIAGQLLEYCLKEKGKSKLDIKIHSFPEDPQGKENFLAALEKLR